MKLSKLYCNQPFQNIEFNLENGGLNIILADVKKKSDDTNTHNLGKSTLLDLIDFLLLRDTKKDHWLLSTTDRNRQQVFENYSFYMEILLNSGKYLTIKRCVNENTKISFKLHEKKANGFVEYDFWDNDKLALSKAKRKLAEYLDFTYFDDKPYDFRKSLGYCLRRQGDYLDVFRLDKFVGKHKNWKPFMFDLLGFDGGLLWEKLDLDDEIEKQKNVIKEQEKDFDIKANERDKIVGQIQFKEKEKSQIENELNNFDFYGLDLKTIELADKIEEEISDSNSTLFKVEFDIRKLQNSIEEKTFFDTDLVKETFEQVKIHFSKDLVKSYSELEVFNKQITEERNLLLRETLEQRLVQRAELKTKLFDLHNQKKKYSGLIQQNSVMIKMREHQGELRKIENELGRFQAKLEGFGAIDRRNDKIDELKKKSNIATKKLESLANTTSGNEKYTAIRNTFAEIVNQILQAPALISIKQNSIGNIDFLYSFDDGTAKDKGFTYGKLLCVAFDLAVLINYRNESYYRFIYHDDVFANEDNRVKQRLLNVILGICEKYDLQYICSVIKDELPRDESGRVIEFSADETVLRLHDKDDLGKLFLMSF
jgi:uncharacterized protein YydD (DUF2326 family)